MSDAASWIADLDNFLATDGEEIVLRRVVGTGNQAVVDVPLIALVKPGEPEALSGGNTVAQETFLAITSPTQINRAQWPGGVAPDFIGDPRFPALGYKAVIRARARQIERVAPLIRGGVLVRLEFYCKG